MATNDALNNNLSGQTGTGQYVGDTSSILVTPDIGVATGSSINLSTTTTIDGFLDEDDMVSDSNSKGSTQQSIKAYVDTTNQVVQYVLATSATIDTTSVTGTYQASSLSATITPTNIAHKIGVYCFAPNKSERTSGSIIERFTALRIQNTTDAVTLCSAFSGEELISSSNQPAPTYAGSTLIGEETAPSVNPTTYQLQFYSGNVTATSTINPTGTGPALMLIVELLV